MFKKKTNKQEICSNTDRLRRQKTQRMIKEKTVFIFREELILPRKMPSKSICVAANFKSLLLFYN